MRVFLCIALAAIVTTIITISTLRYEEDTYREDGSTEG